MLHESRGGQAKALCVARWPGAVQGGSGPDPRNPTSLRSGLLDRAQPATPAPHAFLARDADLCGEPSCDSSYGPFRVVPQTSSPLFPCFSWLFLSSTIRSSFPSHFSARYTHLLDHPTVRCAKPAYIVSCAQCMKSILISEWPVIEDCQSSNDLPCWRFISFQLSVLCPFQLQFYHQ